LSESSKLNSSKEKMNEEERKAYFEDKFIWDKQEVVDINKKRMNINVIPMVFRYKEQNLGIRAHRNMGVGKCFLSLVMPWHNEWVSIMLYLVFAVYFWVQLFMIMLGEHSYDFQGDSVTGEGKSE
jgi:hypothetical protein